MAARRGMPKAGARVAAPAKAKQYSAREVVARVAPATAGQQRAAAKVAGRWAARTGQDPAALTDVLGALGVIGQAPQGVLRQAGLRDEDP